MTLRRQLRNSLGSVFWPQNHILFSRLWTVPSGLFPRVSCLIAFSLSIIINLFCGPCRGLLFFYSSCLLQVVQRILDTVLWPSPVKAHWVACQQNLCQTWEWTFSAPWDRMVMKCLLQNCGQVYEQNGALPTENWHLPSMSTKIKSCPLQLLTFNAPERSSGWKSGMRHCVLIVQALCALCSGKNSQNRPSDS